MTEAKWVILDLEVTKYYIFIRNGKVTRKYRFGKAEIIEATLGSDWANIPKAEGEHREQ